ncbi:MAG: hypothetical protein M1832_001738 [Thelocarpon impressellum]|nr:MAG: hypothetical protein M1832_001738 [Thelocarpon impressellum]
MYNKPQPPPPQQTPLPPPHPRHSPIHPPQGNLYGSPGGGFGLPQDPVRRDYGSPAGGGGAGYHYGMSSPPPTNYARPPPQAHPRPAGNYGPPPSPAPPAGSGNDGSLLPLFRAVDKDGSGHLTERELGAALVNGDWTAFDPQTVRMMIRMFDTEKTGRIDFEAFCGLWGFLAAWRALFDRFDEDRSGNINYDEYSKALVAFGYRLTPQFVQVLFRTYDKRGENAISFDLFVQSCISLKRMTDVFKKYDDDRDGYITLSFEEFLTEILRQR